MKETFGIPEIPAAILKSSLSEIYALQTVIIDLFGVQVILNLTQKIFMLVPAKQSITLSTIGIQIFQIVALSILALIQGQYKPNNNFNGGE